MRKNVAGQHVGAEVLNVSNGAGFAGAVTVKVRGDAGAQAPGLGAVINKGGGDFDYAPTQAETNYTYVAYLFEGSGAISVLVQVYTEQNAAGVGALPFTYTLTNSVNSQPIADADIWVSSDSGGVNVLANGRTNQSGQVTFYLDAGTVYVWRQKSGWNFDNPDTETVS